MPYLGDKTIEQGLTKLIEVREFVAAEERSRGKRGAPYGNGPFSRIVDEIVEGYFAEALGWIDRAHRAGQLFSDVMRDYGREGLVQLADRIGITVDRAMELVTFAHTYSDAQICDILERMPYPEDVTTK